MSNKGIWYVDFPTHQYKEDVKALAKENGLRIVDARFDDGEGEKDVPELTLKSEPVQEAEKPKPASRTKRKTKKVD